LNILKQPQHFFFWYYLPMILKQVLITLTIEYWEKLICSTYDQFLSRGRLLTDKLMLQGFLQSRLMSTFCKFYDRYNDLIHNHKLSLSHMLSDIFIPTVRPYLAHWLWQRITPHSWSWNWAHGGCDRLTGDAYSPRHLLQPQVFQGVRVSLIFILYYGLFHLLDLDTDFDCRFLPFTWFDTLILAAGSSVSLILTLIWLMFILRLKWDSRRVGPVNRGCLFFLGTWPHLPYPGVRVGPFISLTCNSYLCFEIDHSLVS
jgi:hypothetical protein